MFKSKNAFFIAAILALSILLSACQPVATPAAATPSLPQPTSTTVVDFSEEENISGNNSSRPTATLAPTATPYPPLAAEGPYFAYIAYRKNQPPMLTVLNADASGRKQISLPQGNCAFSVFNDLSPDGRWLAFYSGSIGEPYEGCAPSGDVYDLQINLMNVESGEILPITRLVGPDFPANFSRVAERILNQMPAPSDGAGSVSLEQETGNVREAFYNDFYSFAWSPNSRFLAFAGQMNGDTSDVYVYDLTNQSITQVTDGITEISSIQWSPDGEWILNTGILDYVGEGMSFDLFATRRDGSVSNYLGNFSAGIEWADDTHILAHDSENGPGDFNLVMIDITNGEQSSIWAGAFSGVAFDPDSGSMAIAKNEAYFDGQSSGPTALEITQADGQVITAYNGFCPWILYRGGTRDRFLASCDGISGMDASGNLYPLGKDSGPVSISPDYRWMFLGNTLFDSNDQAVRTYANLNPGFYLWRPDSGGVYIGQEGRLYYVPIPDGDPILIENELEDYAWWYDGYRWVQ